MHEYAFDIKLGAVVRVIAQDEDEARRMLMDLSTIGGVPGPSMPPGMTITECSIDDVDTACLFEIDGDDPEAK